MNNNQIELKPLQSKTIERICKAKIHNWANSVKKSGNDDVYQTILDNVIITGGSLVSLLSGTEVNDFDIYFRTKESAVKVAEYYVSLFKEQNQKWINEKVSLFDVVSVDDRVRIKIKSQGVVSSEQSSSPTEYEYFESTNGNEAETFLQNLTSYQSQDKTGYVPVFISDNAITLSDKIQIVIRFFGEPEQIHKNYDFVHCTNYYTSWDDKLTLNLPAMESIRTKNLKYVGSLYPICSVLRLRKFISRGWKINAGQMLKIIWQIKDLDLNNIDVLQDQLTGVDSAYFSEMIDILNKDKLSGKTIDQTYISNLIDIVFEN